MRAPITLYRLGFGAVLVRVRLVVLTTRGRKSRKPRHTAIEVRTHNKKMYLISGWGQESQWVKNLLADPTATIRVGNRVQYATAQQVCDAGEVMRALHLFRKTAPAFYDPIIARVADTPALNADTLQNAIPHLTVFRLDITETPNDLPPVRPDLIWMWGMWLVGGISWSMWAAKSPKQAATPT
ncbi:MAG: nitroreductase family deazaflavin-dependent oxidoreductase [Phototrophicaceae bacterium]